MQIFALSALRPNNKNGKIKSKVKEKENENKCTERKTKQQQKKTPPDAAGAPDVFQDSGEVFFCFFLLYELTNTLFSFLFSVAAPRC